MTDISKLKKDEVVELADSLQKELSEKDKQIEDMKSEFDLKMEEMRKMIMSMNQPQPQTVTQSVGFTEEPTVTIKCYLLGKNNISLDKETTIRFDYCGAEEEVTYGELKNIIKFGKNKSLFSDGLLTLDEKEIYDRFKIKPRREMTDEYIVSVFSMNEKDFLEELKVITNNKTSSPALHSFIYRSAYLYKNGSISGVTKPLADAFKSYFGRGITDVYIDDDIL